MKKIISRFIGCAGMLCAGASWAGPDYQWGHINNVTYADDYMMIMLDAPVPTNCTGTSYGWMKIPAANKPMMAFVTALWMRGDAAQVQVTVYTSGLVGPYCVINQIDPTN